MGALLLSENLKIFRRIDLFIGIFGGRRKKLLSISTVGVRSSFVGDCERSFVPYDRKNLKISFCGLTRRVGEIFEKIREPPEYHHTRQQRC